LTLTLVVTGKSLLAQFLVQVRPLPIFLSKHQSIAHLLIYGFIANDFAKR
jgi:hypothetical protein